MENNRLSGLENQSVTRNAQPYSRFVRSLKFIFPLIALGFIGLLILWPQLSKIEMAPLSQNDLQALKSAKTQNTLLNPTYNTVDANNRPVEIHAGEARQNKNKQNEVFLDKPNAKLNDNANILELRADKGIYNQDTKILNLNQAVVIKDSENNVLETENLIANINTNKATSTGAAKLTTNQGVITSTNGVIIDQQNQTTIFQGPAKAVINQK